MHIPVSKLGDDPIQTLNLLKEINLGTEADKRPIYISSKLDPDFKEKLVQLLKKYRDCFAWTYEEIPGLDRQLVEHGVTNQTWLSASYSTTKTYVERYGKNCGR